MSFNNIGRNYTRTGLKSTVLGAEAGVPPVTGAPVAAVIVKVSSRHLLSVHSRSPSGLLAPRRQAPISRTVGLVAIHRWHSALPRWYWRRAVAVAPAPRMAARSRPGPGPRRLLPAGKGEPARLTTPSQPLSRTPAVRVEAPQPRPRRYCPWGHRYLHKFPASRHDTG